MKAHFGHVSLKKNNTYNLLTFFLFYFSHQTLRFFLNLKNNKNVKIQNLMINDIFIFVIFIYYYLFIITKTTGKNKKGKK